MRRFRVVFVATLFLCSVKPALPSSYKWLSKFTEQSSKDLAATYSELLKPHLAAVQGVPVQDMHWKDQFLDLHLVSGAIWVEPAVQGYPAMAFFSGKATVTYSPSCQKAHGDMAYWFGKERLEQEPVTEVFFFTLRGRSLLEQLGAPASPPSVPLQSTDAYELSKAAFGQLGTDPLRAFLNREGSAKGAAYLVLTAPGIRVKSSSDALLMYRYDPELAMEVGLLASGHSQVVETGTNRYLWWNMGSCRLRKGPFLGPGRVEEYSIDVKAGRASDSAEEDATMRVTLAAGVSAFREGFTPQLEVKDVTGPDGAPLPFLQWRYLSNDPNHDGNLLISTGGKHSAGQPVSIRVRAAGTLFEPVGTAHYIIDEDDWYPHMEGAQSAIYDVTITVPSEQVAVAAGQLIEDKKTEDGHRFHYRSTKPLKAASLHYGPFDTGVGKADGTEIRVYGVHGSVSVRQNMDFVKTEMENTVKIFNRLYRPLDFPLLRIVGTPEDHGRGFEGLILLSQRAGFDSASSFADVFRAHEVAHQWWGNVVQPMNWPEDRWISESFAEYSAMEYYRIRYEDPNKTNERIYVEWTKPLTDSFKRTVWTLKGEKHEYEASQVSPLIDGGGNVYTKGPIVLHMLRYAFKVTKGGDEGFWSLLRTFLEKHPYQQVSTADFIAEAETALGGPIPWFWDQWLYHTEIPIVRWAYTIEPKDGKFLLTITGAQEGTTFNLVIPVFLHFKQGRVMSRPLPVKGASGQLKLMLPEEPSSVTLNDTWEALVILKK